MNWLQSQVRAPRPAFGAVAIAVLLAGCSGGGISAPAPPGSAPQAVRRAAAAVVGDRRAYGVTLPGFGSVAPETMPAITAFADPDAAQTATLVVSDNSRNVVFAFNAFGKIVGAMTGFAGPSGLAVDPAGDVYTANSGAQNIIVYKNDYRTQLATLDDAGAFPTGVAYDPVSKTLGVTNISSVSGGAGSVVFYAPGTTTPCAQLTSPNFAKFYFDAFDAAGNLYVDGLDANESVVVGVIRGGCKATAITTLKTKNTLLFPGGVAVARNGNVAIDDQSAAAIYSYAPALNGSLGVPLTTTPLNFLGSPGDPVAFALQPHNERLWVTAIVFGIGSAFEYLYPAGQNPISVVRNIMTPIGIAVTPVASR